MPKFSLVILLVGWVGIFQLSLLAPLFLFVGLFSLFVGSLTALYQTKLMRLVAFSGVANIGYILLACANASYSAVLYYVFVYICLNLTFFSLIFLIKDMTFRVSPTLNDFAKVYYISPVLAAFDSIHFVFFCRSSAFGRFF